MSRAAVLPYQREWALLYASHEPLQSGDPIHAVKWRYGTMMKFDHLSIPVTDLARSRDWYTMTLGLKVEFEVPEQNTTALQDSEGFAIFLREAASPVRPNGCAMWFQVVDVEATFSECSAREVEFAHGPRKSYWGYGVELVDPDGYLVRLWDERSMNEK
jgi:catechol 2,3-dioxygenase-like lactoylglutathione lyase family enzyme